MATTWKEEHRKAFVDYNMKNAASKVEHGSSGQASPRTPRGSNYDPYNGPWPRVALQAAGAPSRPTIHMLSPRGSGGDNANLASLLAKKPIAPSFDVLLTPLKIRTFRLKVGLKRGLRKTENFK